MHGNYYLLTARTKPLFISHFHCCMHITVCHFYRIGPLVRHWTMRFEAKHQYLKSLASSMGNYINVCYSLAMRHQSYQCYLQTSDSGFCVDHVKIGNGINGTSYNYFCCNDYTFCVCVPVYLPTCYHLVVTVVGYSIIIMIILIF